MKKWVMKILLTLGNFLFPKMKKTNRNLISEKEYMKELTEQIDELRDICSLIEASILEEPPIATKEGGIIKDGFHEQVDSLREAKREGKNRYVFFEK